MIKKEFFGQLQSINKKNDTLEFPYLESVKLMSFYSVYESFESRYFLFNFPEKRNFIWLSKSERKRIFTYNFDYFRSFLCKYIEKKSNISSLNIRIYKFKKLRLLGLGKRKKLVYFFDGCKLVRFVKNKNLRIRKKKAVLYFYKNIGKLTYDF